MSSVAQCAAGRGVVSLSLFHVVVCNLGRHWVGPLRDVPRSLEVAARRGRWCRSYANTATVCDMAVNSVGCNGTEGWHKIEAWTASLADIDGGSVEFGWPSSRALAR